MRKNNIAFVSLLFFCLHSFGQFSDSLFHTPASDTQFWNQKFKLYNAENNPNATLLIAEIKNIESQETAIAQLLLNDSLLSEYRKSIIGDLPVNKKRLSKGELAELKNSLFHQEGKDVKSTLEIIRTQINFLPIHRDKKRIIQYIDSVENNSVDPLIRLAALHEKYDLAIRLKEKKGANEAQEKIAAFRKIQEKNHHQFLKTLIQDLSSPTLQKKNTPIAPEVKENKYMEKSIIAVLAFVIIGLFTYAIITRRSWIKKLRHKDQLITQSGLAAAMADDRIASYEQTIQKLQNDLRSVSENASNRENKENQFYQELKSQVDKVIKNPEVAQVMELKNLVSRHIASK